MTKETIAVCAAIVSAVAAVVVVPEVRDWTCTNFVFLCKRDSITAPKVSNTPVVSTPTIPAPSPPVTETPPRPTQPSTSGGTQVAVGVYPETPKTHRNSIGMEFVLIPAGEFQMGANEGFDNEKPVHTVRLSKPFYLEKYEITQGQWQMIMGNNPSWYQGDMNRPVELVSWEDVQEFIRRLNQKESGTKYRLPNEAEWEYAARAGRTTSYGFGNDVSQLGTYAWYDKNAGNTTHPVGQKQPNPWGLYDMHGNVWEWVQDWYGSYPMASAVDPTGPASGTSRVRRGGSSFNDSRFVRSARRFSSNPSNRDAGIGFRLALEVR